MFSYHVRPDANYRHGAGRDWNRPRDELNYTDGVFFVFFSITFVFYYLAWTERLQVAVLVLSSLVFYAWASPALLLVFAASWLITGISSYVVLNTRHTRTAKGAAITGVVANLALLGFFKYKFLFLAKATLAILAASHSPGEWLLLAPLPIGISFYTFHGISLVIDVFRGDQAFAATKARPSRHLANTLLYLVFFPQLIAGPIIKARNFFPQVARKRLDEVDFSGCARVLILGYFLKSVVADNLTGQTYWIAYPYFQWRSSVDLLAMLYGYSAQIFADFAGYSLIAIGLARLLGYRLPDNFNFPYLATSVADFWRRWHISLSSWLRDYLYIPLGGSRHGTGRTYFNLMIVMLLGGLWHGAAWSFAVWGLWHAIGLALERPWLATNRSEGRSRAVLALRMFVVFHFVTIGWLFFKLQDFTEAWSYLGILFHGQVAGASRSLLCLTAVYCACVAGYHIAGACRHRIPGWLKQVAYGAMLFLIITSAGPKTPFIYFQF
jgi:alginate O-acetyltransferase complex protein AlgI